MPRLDHLFRGESHPLHLKGSVRLKRLLRAQLALQIVHLVQNALDVALEPLGRVRSGSRALCAPARPSFFSLHRLS